MEALFLLYFCYTYIVILLLMLLIRLLFFLSFSVGLRRADGFPHGQTAASSSERRRTFHPRETDLKNGFAPGLDLSLDFVILP